MAEAVPALPPTAPSARDGQRGGECLSHPSGGGGSGQCLDAEPGAFGAAVSVPRAAGAGSGSGGGGAGTHEETVTDRVERGGGESRKTGAGGRSSPGGGVAVWE